MSTTPTIPNLPSLFTFAAATGQYLNWFLQDPTTFLPINTSTIVATLYANRSLTNPIGQPGTPVANFTALSLPYLKNTNGQYQALITAAFNPPLGSNYVLVVDATTPGYQAAHSEIAAQVVSGGPIQLATPIVSNPQFRSDYPEFSDPNTYSESSLSYWFMVASKLLNACRWDDMLGVATELFVAHNLVLQARAQQTALVSGWPGVSRGAINSESAGAVTVSYDTATTLEPDAGHWNLTDYGTRFIRLARMFGSGPIQIGPCIFGFVTEFPGAWPGPWPFPGMWNFG